MEGEPYTDTNTQNTPKDGMTLTERKAREEAFCLEKVTEQVSCVKDRIDQRGPRDSNSRNKDLRKIVRDTRNNGEILVAESEDFIIIFFFWGAGGGGCAH